MAAMPYQNDTPTLAERLTLVEQMASVLTPLPLPGDEGFVCNCASCRRSRAVWGPALIDDDIDTDDDDVDEYDDDGDNDGPTESVIRYHDYRPTPIFNGVGPVYLGMELEVEAAIEAGYQSDPRGRERWVEGSRYADAQFTQKRMGGLVYIKDDSSIRNGFEIVTHPMSYPWAMERFPWEVLTALRERGLSVHEDVGIHVHVSRKAFGSECHLYRWMKFVYRNARQVQRLARRRNDEWCSFDAQYRAEVKHYMKGGGGDRYQAINPNNSATLEVRVFASSLEPDEVKAALAFVASTVEYTRDLDSNKIIRERGWAWSTFVDWLRDHNEYAPLLGQLEALECVS